VEKSAKLKSKVAGVEIVGSPKDPSKEEGPENMSEKSPGGDTGDICIRSGSDSSFVQMDAAVVVPVVVVVVVVVAVSAAMGVGIVAGTS